MEIKLITRTHFPSFFMIMTLLALNLLIPIVMSTSFEDQKNYYRHGSPHHSTPSHGTPSHGGGSYNPTPSTPTPSVPTPVVPTPSDPTPSEPTPSVPNCGSPPHGGGYYHSPPSTTPTTPDVPTPIDPTPPTPVYTSPPTTPSYSPPPSGGSPPYVPDPNTPSYSPPSIGGSPPSVPDPNTPPFTCNYWRNHPGMIWGLVGWWGTLGHAFGVTSVPGFGSDFNLHQALSNTRTDGLGQLYREGTASLLNSMVYNKFPFTTKQVRDSFISALGSNNAAAAQARFFKLANEGRLKPRA
ncbi:hypothetical protein FEM48_Zijuj04G0164500 [Ziziphus jujuba var. spinosa]|uniref:Protodermal factor 1-like n=1 Tax=Ziziphus jujuba var. spinosa TaxID=714518 RepID=A0A978VKX8_ZIZJJ|nr:hypothetical protein FEM48_Zijuj04G0164500 [Ziziphus jujuba var. spinosa]